jgi:hypothetical protein
VSTHSKLVDILTKPLDEKRFCQLRSELNILDLERGLRRCTLAYFSYTFDHVVFITFDYIVVQSVEKYCPKFTSPSALDAHI